MTPLEADRVRLFWSGAPHVGKYLRTSRGGRRTAGAAAAPGGARTRTGCSERRAPVGAMTPPSRSEAPASPPRSNQPLWDEQYD